MIQLWDDKLREPHASTDADMQIAECRELLKIAVLITFHVHKLFLWWLSRNYSITWHRVLYLTARVTMFQVFDSL